MKLEARNCPGFAFEDRHVVVVWG